MASSNSSDNGSNRSPDIEQKVEDIFSSEKREDVWALIIAAVILVLSAAFPTEVQHFFSKTLYLF